MAGPNAQRATWPCFQTPVTLWTRPALASVIGQAGPAVWVGAEPRVQRTVEATPLRKATRDHGPLATTRARLEPLPFAFHAIRHLRSEGNAAASAAVLDSTRARTSPATGTRHRPTQQR